MDRDVYLLLTSRIMRSVSAGVLAVVVGLYYVNELHLTLFEVGVLFGVGAFLTPLLTLILGFYSDKYGRKRILLITLSFLPISVLILLLTSNFFLLLLSSALGGFGIAGGLVGGGVGATVAPMQTALLTEKIPPEERTKVFSIFTTISSYAGAGGALLSHLPSYRTIFIMALIISGISTLSVIPLRESFKPRVKKVPTSSGDKDVIKKFTITGVLNGVSQGLIVPFIPIIFSKTYGLSQSTIGDIVSIGGVVSATLMLSTPSLTKRLGFVRLIILTRSISAVLVLLFPFLSLWYLASIDYIVFTPLRVLSLPAQQALMMNLIGEGRRATVSGANQAGRLIPSAFSTSLSGYLMRAVSIAMPFEIAFLATLINSFLYYSFFRSVDKLANGSVTIAEG
ncbi:MFS transporter [Metallosphaera cuprina]|uniref:Major facilitator transporter n=1 Tax=Metallosphaera cuprina (strain Ar-4) TaxID=1006006 RepID=F4G2R0_METCR|nr:MFS transporter [Metallosphaera cuprina]AEB95108.1 major facilitator transporter [Metallosphaera cuprina Ar-4]